MHWYIIPIYYNMIDKNFYNLEVMSQSRITIDYIIKSTLRWSWNIRKCKNYTVNLSIWNWTSVLHIGFFGSIQANLPCEKPPEFVSFGRKYTFLLDMFPGHTGK